MPFESKVYNYNLPKESINQTPYTDPNLSKLLIADTKQIIEFKDINSIIKKPALFILNKSQVQSVRVVSKKSTGGKIEVFVLDIRSTYIATCLIKSTDKKVLNKKYKLQNFNFEIIRILNDTYEIKFNIPVTEIIKSHGQIPLPPYIKDDSSKYEYYNNQFAEGGFSVASPTAGLHFSNKQIQIDENLQPCLVIYECTSPIQDYIVKEGHQFIFINLDVNVDTFKPITERYLEDHKIHKENYQISKNDFEIILNAKNSNIDIYCIGTTSLRAIESAYVTGELSSSTDYFIYPDTKINIPNYLITNFHAPNSSLLSIVDCIYGSQWKDLYNFAIDSELKFLSFGDAVLFNVNE